MWEKVFYTSVLVSDQDRALDFYNDVLGLEHLAPDGRRILTVGVEGGPLSAGSLAWDVGAGRAGDGTPRASITCETDDCLKTVEELKSRGVEFISDVLEFSWGYVAHSSRTPTPSPKMRLALLSLSPRTAPAHRTPAPVT